MKKWLTPLAVYVEKHIYRYQRRTFFYPYDTANCPNSLKKDKAKHFLNYVRCCLQRVKDKKSPAKNVHREPYFFTNMPVFIVNSI